MVARKKLFISVLGSVVLLGVIMIITLEIGSRKISCPDLPTGTGWLCFGIGDELEAQLPSIEQRIEIITQLREKHQQDILISKKEYRVAFEKLVILVDPELLRDHDSQFNGIACGTIGYTRNDLPEQATLYVRRHELDHILFNSGEFEANLAGFKEYTIGGIQITWITFRENLPRMVSTPCHIFVVWSRAKEYFLPFQK